MPTVSLDELTVTYNTFSIPPKSELSFFFFDIRGAQNITATNLSFNYNQLHGINSSATDPFQFALIRFNFQKRETFTYSAFVDNFSSLNNIQLSPLLFACEKKTNTKLVIQNSIFVDNMVSVAAGVEVTGLSSTSTLDVYNCRFINNTIYDASSLTQWDIGQGVISCNGRGALHVFGNETEFSGNQKSMRSISGSCKKTCDGLVSSLALFVCGQEGITTATILMSSIVGAVIIGLVIYHIIYMTFILPKKRLEIVS